MTSGGYLVVGPCFSCGRVFSFNPHLVPSIPVDPANQLPADVGEHAPDARFERQQICRDCVEAANRKRRRYGREPIRVLPGAYDLVEGLPD